MPQSAFRHWLDADLDEREDEAPEPEAIPSPLIQHEARLAELCRRNELGLPLFDEKQTSGPTSRLHD